jgi:hypothetical protein
MMNNKKELYCQCGCGSLIEKPSSSHQRFLNMDHFNTFRREHPRTKRGSALPEISDISIPPAPASVVQPQSLPIIENMTIGEIKTKFAELQVRMLEASSYKHLYMELLIKIRELLPREEEHKFKFIMEDGTMQDAIKANKSISPKGIPNLLRARKKIIKPAIEEFVEDNPAEVKLEPAHKPILKDGEEPVIDDFKELD